MGRHVGRDRLVVIGGDAAGMSAASQARRGRPDLEIVAIERGNYTSYSACGIPYFVAGDVPTVDRLIARDPGTFERDHDIRVRLRHEAEEIDLDRCTVLVRSLEDGSTRTEPYDQLMVATGAVPRVPDLPGADARGVYGVQTLDDAVALEKALSDGPAQRAVVVGAGFIGLEMAEAMLRRGIAVTVVDQAAQPLATLDPDMGALVADSMREIGIEVRLDEPVAGFDTRAGRVCAVATEAGTLPADLVVLGLGVRPAADLAAAAGLAVGPTGGVVTDRRMSTSTPGVWAAGDCAQTWHRLTCGPAAIPLGTHANKQGRVAGTNIAGGYATFPGVIGTALTKVCGVEVSRTGLSEREAVEAGFRVVTGRVVSTVRAGYYPEASEMTLKIVADRRSGRLLGGQIVGREGSAKRIDALAVAVWNGMTAEEMAGLDLGYAPPFAPVWDPLLIGARKAAERVGETGPP